MFQVKVQKNIARLTVQEKMTSGSQDVYVVGFEFSEEWAYLERTAVFKSGDVIVNVLLDDTNQCLIPWEVLTNYDATVSMGVFGTKDGRVVLPTIWAKTDAILEGVVTGVYPSEPTPDVYQQLLARLASIEEDIASGAIKGESGATFTPAVSESGELSWTNDGGLPNPDPVNIKGSKGDKGDTGDPGPQGPSGADGQPGAKGDKGDKGDTGDVGPQGPAGQNGTDGAQGPAGKDGKSAYQVAVDNGFTGTEQEWLDSLKASGVTEEQVQEMINTSVEQIELTPGPQGKPGVIFTPAVSESGELSWTNDGGLSNPAPANIKGAKGDKGDTGDTGPQGPAGADSTVPGPKGNDGDPGVTFTPSVSESGELSWTNDGGLPNPDPVNIMGPAGPSGSGSSLTAGDGVTIANDTISVSLPTKALTTAEYNALSEEEKQADVLYVITDDNSSGSGSLTPQSIVITTPPDKTSYNLGDTFDSTGMVVTAIYDGGFSKIVTNYSITPDGPLEAGIDKVTISYTENGITVTAKQPISVIVIHVYGATWDGTSTTKWTRTDESSLFTDPVPYVAGATEYGSPFDNLMPWSGMVKEERTGGTMVAIPKFWYKLEQNTPGTPSSGMSIKIADGPVDGFSVSPAHMDRGDGKGERDVVYVGRYHCAASNYKSKPGEKPKVNITRPTARIEIRKLGENIWQMDYVARFTILLLYLVEFADWNSQVTIGWGCGNGSSVEPMGYTDSMPYHTGTTQSNRGTYGLGTQYRNIEGLWDNALDWEDGCYYNNDGLNIILNPNDFSDSSGGISVGVPTTGFPSEISVKNVSTAFMMFIPTASRGSGVTYSCDWCDFMQSWHLCVGGFYTHNEKFGLFCQGIGDASYAHVGARLQELP